MGSEKSFVVQPVINNKNTYGDSTHNVEYFLEEALNLTKALGTEVIGGVYNNLREINPATFLSKGFLESLKITISTNEISLLVVNYDISAIQQRNLEKYLYCKVLDRNGLIINIFSKRAKSKEGKFQAELASLLYQKSRLVKAWSHLERQRGGGGFIGGPGETQKELDKRIITEKISYLKKQLAKLQQNRKTQGNSRKKNDAKIVALVGYTNAGKSTLFNKLTNSNVFDKDLLFATLDPTMRALNLKSKEKIILLDTVGFVADLPHQLIESFKSTLDEAQTADLILHVIDSSQPNIEIQIDSVKSVLKQLGINEEIYKQKVIEVYNKVDVLITKENEENNLLDNFFKEKNEEENIYQTSNSISNINILKDNILTISTEKLKKECNKNNQEEENSFAKIKISARENIKLEELKNLILEYFNREKITLRLELDYSNYGILTFIYKNSFILNKAEDNANHKIILDFIISKSKNEILQRKLDPNYGKELWQI